MKKSRFSEDQIIRILAEVETGRKVSEVCRQYKVSEGTIYRWKQKYGGMDQQELKRKKELEAENARLKKIVAQYAMDIDTLKELLGKD